MDQEGKEYDNSVVSISPLVIEIFFSQAVLEVLMPLLVHTVVAWVFLPQ